MPFLTSQEKENLKDFSILLVFFVIGVVAMAVFG